MGYAQTKFELTNELELHTCGECGTPFGIESKLHANLKKSGRGFYCPNGHCRAFIVGKTEAEKAREEIERIRQILLCEQTALATERQLRVATETKMNKLKKRVGNGVCPCCKRSFSNLHRHMHSKHPEFKKPEATKIA